MLVTAVGVVAGEAVGLIDLNTIRQLSEVDFIFQVGPLSRALTMSAALVGVFISVWVRWMADHRQQARARTV